MSEFTEKRKRIGLALLPLAAAMVMGVLGSVLPAPGASSPQTAVAAAVGFHLWAKTGSVTMPDAASIPIWGFSTTQTGDATLPGPTLVVTEGDVVTITLHNSLGENVSLLIPGQNLVPDFEGVASGGTKSYTFTAKVGTYLYESGVNQRTQVQMGLHGALIVRPKQGPKYAYNSATAFDQESILVLSEIDPAWHANPAGFNPLDFSPKYWLINGKGYPQTQSIGAQAGKKLLFRYLNAGYQHHTLQLLGMHQQLIASDANQLRYPRTSYSQTVAAGETHDLISTIPAGTPVGTRFPLYGRNMELTNGSGASFPGGMLTFVTVQ
ncbi:MAG: multicopper oxidase domain-containing protein [Chloroflexota bacterium]